MTTSDSSTCRFVSDLHLFSSRSTGPQWMEAINQSVRDSQTFVLGGDIFDFKWSTLQCDKRSTEMAERWIVDLMQHNPECNMHFVLGNHDSHPIFVDRLESIAQRHTNFHWHRYFVRMDQCLFLHGDVADGKLAHDQLDRRRQKIEAKKPRRKHWHVAYDLAIKAKLHHLAMMSIRELKVLKCIRQYADQIQHSTAEGVTDVFFGHTHIDLDGVEYRGMKFHNGGAAIQGLPFRILQADLGQPQLVQGH
ncbi:Calcineurin-like phosphoesterase superfamily domain protein [Stieleria bergensis]|uniref:Calcineurin-like phosphoesterase superfamily domain protein n=1 Tax=Stieleria bergensis TaxID=2528025 RepID=A0A517SQ11_9BACT|nr:MAG: hypothetical protein CBB71_21075 [Rhodopirellula sp. TMED11]QDT58214.1 Calcineurin-like phosphoesterase superfamily domain protein [Planctomycetes bacterium SV_7m_r]